MQLFFRDIRYAARQLGRSPAFTIVAILTLALGVGANTAIFSLVQAVLLHPAGIAEPDRVASFHVRYIQLNLPSIGVSVPDFADALSLKNVVSSAALESDDSVNSIRDGRAEHLLTAAVTWQWFQVFGARPILGRTFTAEEDQADANHVVVLSYSAWQRMFGGQPDAIGKTLILNEQPYRVIGVMRSDFDWPRGRDLWMPLGLKPTAFAADLRYNESYSSVVRLQPGVTVEQFNAALDQKHREQIAREGSASFGKSSGWSMFAQPLSKDAAGSLRKPLVALFAVVSMILLLACANVAGLLLARSSARARELAIRTALGATLLQLIRQFFLETLLLASAATLVGMVAGPVFGKLLLWAIPNHLADGFVVQSNTQLILATASFGLLAALLAGLAPAMQLLRKQKSLDLNEFGRANTASAAKQKLRMVLVIGEVALAFLLLSSTGIFLSGLKDLEQVNPGFRAEGILTGGVTLSGPSYRNNDERKRIFLQTVTEQLAAQSQVTSAAAVFPLPFGSTAHPSSSFEIKESPTSPNAPSPHGDRVWATSGFLSTMQIPLLSGRWFTDDDRNNTQPVAVIDDVLAHAYWPNQNPIGQHVRTGSQSSWREIVGVVRHIRKDSLEEDENKGVTYVPYMQNPVGEMAFVIRAKGNPYTAGSLLQQAVHQADAAQTVFSIQSLEALVSNSLASRQLIVSLLSVFGGVALLLAIIGLYGLLSFAALQRTMEIGVRMALGAQRSQIITMILREALVLVGIGLAAGAGLALSAQRVLTHFFVAMGTGVAQSLAMSAVLLLITASLAALLPAGRAASIEPVQALRRD